MKMNTGSSSADGAGRYHSAKSSQRRPLKTLDSFAVRIRCSRGQEICSQGRAANSWYRVISGTARRFVLQPDGRRQIVDLLLPGDFFGFAAGDEYDYTVEAIPAGTLVAGYPRRRIEAL